MGRLSTGEWGLETESKMWECGIGLEDRFLKTWWGRTEGRMVD